MYGKNTVGYADVIYVPGSDENRKNEELAGQKNGIIHVGRSGSVYIYLPGFLIGISIITGIFITILIIRDHKKYLIRKAIREKEKEERKKRRESQKAKRAQRTSLPIMLIRSINKNIACIFDGLSEIIGID